MNRIFLPLMALSLSVALTGCIRMGPDFQKPDMGAQVRASYQHGILEDGAGQISDRWWTTFNDPELDRVVEGVVSGNLDIKKALAAISEVQSYFSQSRADRFPHLQLQGTAGRQRSAYLGRGDETDTYAFSLPASFEIDLWGKLARAEEAALATLLKTEESARTVAQTSYPKR